MVASRRKQSQMVANDYKWSQTYCFTTHCSFVRLRVLSVYPAGAQTRDVDPMAGYFWPTLYDAEPTLAQYCVTMSCLAECGPASQTAGQH